MADLKSACGQLEARLEAKVAEVESLMPLKHRVNDLEAGVSTAPQ